MITFFEQLEDRLESTISSRRWAEAERAITEPVGDPPADTRARAEAGKMEIGEQKVQTTDKNVNSFFRDISEKTKQHKNICALKVGCRLMRSLELE